MYFALKLQYLYFDLLTLTGCYVQLGFCDTKSYWIFYKAFIVLTSNMCKTT